MYNLPYFKEKDAQVLMDFMKTHSFAMLIGCHQDIPVATQVPFLFEERKANCFCKAI
jgi:predicted FMN-binding regulatory protein PaiB